MAFWDELDFIGIQAYFPLTDAKSPDVDALAAGWSEHVAKIRSLASKFKKPVVFTEVGYRSTRDAGIEPWVWPDWRTAKAEEVSFDTQAACYEAMFRTFWAEDWFSGSFVWKWHPKRAGATPTVRKLRRGNTEMTMPSIGFSPQGKPAEDIMRKWYGGAAALSK